MSSAIKYFYVPVKITSSGDNWGRIYEELKKADVAVCAEFDAWRDAKKILAIEFNRIIGSTAKDDYGSEIRVLYEQDDYKHY